MKTLSDYLMEHGILKNQDAVKMAKEITEMFGLEAQHVREWYSVRLERLSQFIRDEIPEPQKTRYFAIIANGTADPLEPPTYASQMNVLRNEKEQAEAACAKKDAALNHWISHNQMDIPRTQDQQEAAGEDFTSVWYETKDALSTDCGKGVMEKVEKLREALRMSKETIIKLNGCYPLEYCSPETRYRWETCKAIEQALEE